MVKSPVSVYLVLELVIHILKNWIKWAMIGMKNNVPVVFQSMAHNLQIWSNILRHYCIELSRISGKRWLVVVILSTAWHRKGTHETVGKGQ